MFGIVLAYNNAFTHDHVLSRTHVPRGSVYRFNRLQNLPSGDL